MLTDQISDDVLVAGQALKSVMGKGPVPARLKGALPEQRRPEDPRSEVKLMNGSVLKRTGRRQPLLKNKRFWLVMAVLVVAVTSLIVTHTASFALMMLAVALVVAMAIFPTRS